MSDKDFIRYLAFDILDIGVRCNFSKTGIDAVETKLRDAFEKKATDAARKAEIDLIKGVVAKAFQAPEPVEVPKLRANASKIVEVKEDGKKADLVPEFRFAPAKPGRKPKA